MRTTDLDTMSVSDRYSLSLSITTYPVYVARWSPTTTSAGPVVVGLFNDEASARAAADDAVDDGRPAPEGGEKFMHKAPEVCVCDDLVDLQIALEVPRTTAWGPTWSSQQAGLEVDTELARSEYIDEMRRRCGASVTFQPTKVVGFGPHGNVFGGLPQQTVHNGLSRTIPVEDVPWDFARPGQALRGFVAGHVPGLYRRG
jgi:hypothetical protein